MRLWKSVEKSKGLVEKMMWSGGRAGKIRAREAFAGRNRRRGESGEEGNAGRVSKWNFPFQINLTD
jgi:hypothetical protein